MFEEQITESIEAGAPDITYSGNEGPKSPQQEQQMQMAQAQEDYRNYVMGQEEAGGQVLPFEQWLRMTYEASRQGAAYGGIMGLDGRKQYGFGSSLKKFVRKIIPNEIADVAVKAAPFVAPFNPLAAGLMSGIGGFDQHGSISKGLKSGLMNYGLGQAGRYIGGAGMQTGINPMSGMSNASSSGIGKYLTSPSGTKTGLGKYFSNKAVDTGQALNEQGLQEIVDNAALENLPIEKQISGRAQDAFIKNTQAKNLTLLDKFKSYIPTSFSDLKDPKKLMGAAGILTLGTKLLGGGPEETIDTIMSRGEGLDIVDIRTRVTEAFKDPSGKLLEELRIEFPYLGTQASKNTAIMAQGGRIGKAEGGLMNLDGMELDYRAEGGFVPIGAEEKADDVPARLSVNEFVFTADAVRNAGGGDIDQGAEIMERVMKNLEQGGQISEETQGMNGAQEMFNVSERLSEVV